MTEKVVAFIPARCNSERLPGKHFVDIGGKTMIQHVVDAVRKCSVVDQIVICTNADPVNDRLREYAKKENVECLSYLGNPDHVTSRLNSAALIYGAGICVLVSGDCPLTDPDSIDRLAYHLTRSPSALLIVPSFHPELGHLAMEGIQVARIKAWQRSNWVSTNAEREHQFPQIYANLDDYSHTTILFPLSCYGPKFRMSVDTLADVRFMNELHAGLKKNGLDFTTKNAVKYVRDNPEILKINEHVKQRMVGE